MSETPADKLSRLRLMAEGDPTWDLSRNDMAAIRHALDTIATLEAGVALDNAVCLCGCPADKHEDYGEDGESCEACEDTGHQCIRVAPAVRDIYVAERAARLAAEARWATTCARCRKPLVVSSVTCGECCSEVPGEGAALEPSGPEVHVPRAGEAP